MDSNDKILYYTLVFIMSEFIGMARKQAPLNGLRSFEAAGRMLSFTKAAKELSVTQAAVSHQVKAVESSLGIPLFFRHSRRLSLTEEGRLLLPEITEAFDKIANALELVKTQKDSTIVNVRLAPSFAAKWLSPRLKYFWLQYPEIDLSLFHAHPAVDFSREQIDIAVTYGRGDWPGVIADPLISLDFSPVCAPEFMMNDKPLTDINNLAYYTLLHDANYECWRDWLSLAGLDSIASNKGTTIDDTNVLIQAAIDGQGVALGSSTFVEDHLESGRLIKPFDLVLKNDFSYYVVCPESKLANPAVRAFKDWLMTLIDEPLPNRNNKTLP
jgi:LysR family transcriptional regulator, glycine cleavage system transcriptional activator